MQGSEELFKGRHFEQYLRYKLSYRDLVDMMAERGLARVTGCSWRADETYVKIHGQCVFLYRAVDRDGNTVDFRLSSKQDVAAAMAQGAGDAASGAAEHRARRLCRLS